MQNKSVRFDSISVVFLVSAAHNASVLDVLLDVLEADHQQKHRCEQARRRWSTDLSLLAIMHRKCFINTHRATYHAVLSGLCSLPW